MIIQQSPDELAARLLHDIQLELPADRHEGIGCVHDVFPPRVSELPGGGRRLTIEGYRRWDLDEEGAPRKSGPKQTYLDLHLLAAPGGGTKVSMERQARILLRRPTREDPLGGDVFASMMATLLEQVALASTTKPPGVRLPAIKVNPATEKILDELERKITVDRHSRKEAFRELGLTTHNGRKLVRRLIADGRIRPMR